MSRLAVTMLILVSAALLPSCGDDGGPPPPIDAPAADASTIDSACGGTTAFLQTCTMDNDCYSCTCRSFGHTMACTQACTVDGDCPAPSGGCSTGFCRP